MKPCPIFYVLSRHPLRPFATFAVDRQLAVENLPVVLRALGALRGFRIRANRNLRIAGISFDSRSWRLYDNKTTE